MGRQVRMTHQMDTIYTLSTGYGRDVDFRPNGEYLSAVDIRATIQQMTEGKAVDADEITLEDT